MCRIEPGFLAAGMPGQGFRSDRDVGRIARGAAGGDVMLDHEAALVAFVKLAGVAQSKRQWSQRDKFLPLPGLAAARPGR